MGRALLAVGSTLVAVWLAEAVARVAWPRPAPETDWRRVSGWAVPDPHADWVLQPGWTSTFDDGVVRGSVRINSRGHRDDEPEDPDVALLGDSFAYGYLLDQSETIDGYMERLSGSPLEVYNMGVTGYGPVHILAAFHTADWLEAPHVFYLFFANDLATAALHQGWYSARRGWQHSTRHEDGTLLTEAEIEGRLQWLGTRPGRRERLADWLSAERLRTLVRRVWIPEGVIRRESWRARHPVNTRRAADLTDAMRALCDRRGCRFRVAIVPTYVAAARGRYFDGTQAYVEEIRRRGHEVVEPLPRLTRRHYLRHDPHLNPSGAQVVAEVLLAALRDEP